jgi:hypothetical protein
MGSWPSEISIGVTNVDSQGLHLRSTTVRATSWCSLDVRKYRVIWEIMVYTSRRREWNLEKELCKQKCARTLGWVINTEQFVEWGIIRVYRNIQRNPPSATLYITVSTWPRIESRTKPYTTRAGSDYIRVVNIISALLWAYNFILAFEILLYKRQHFARIRWIVRCFSASAPWRNEEKFLTVLWREEF